ncbi:helix-turn-helix transcriptional regulator [bacterium 19CA06SA08-2]|uniref:Helix-turn-helix transcriptional regulator n=1 Tax=bacterium 19CA06SA08-2 TaxID=2920658 RepID=A0AAU6UCU4_UNCXX
MPPRESLSLWELEVCQWAAEGKPVSDIAQILGIAPRTVTFHLNRVVEKPGAISKSQAISLVLKQGLVRPNIDALLVGNIEGNGMLLFSAQLLAWFAVFYSARAIVFSS